MKYAKAENAIPSIAVKAMKPWAIAVNLGTRFRFDLIKASSSGLRAPFCNLKEWPAILREVKT